MRRAFWHRIRGHKVDNDVWITLTVTAAAGHDYLCRTCGTWWRR